MEQLKELYESGMSTRELANRFGVTQMTIRRWMKRQGIPARPVSQNKGPVAKGETHAWGPAISAALRGRPSPNKGRRGPDAPNWKGGQQVAPNGRVSIWDPDRKRYIPRAVLAWEEANGSVGRGFVVHHRNAIPSDDRLENLVRLSNSEHLRVHRRHDREYIETLQRILDELGGAYPPYHDET